MGDKRHEAQAGAAARAAVCGRGALEAREKRLDGEWLGLNDGRLVERAPVEQFFAKPQSAQAAAFIKGELPWT